MLKEQQINIMLKEQQPNMMPEEEDSLADLPSLEDPDNLVDSSSDEEEGYRPHC